MKKTSGTTDLTRGPVTRSLIQFYLPLLGSGILQQLYNTVDAIIVGQFMGGDGLAAISAVGEIARIPVNFCIGIASGVAILAAQYFGAKNYRKTAETARTSLWISVLMGIGFTALMILLSGPVSRIMHVPEEIFGSSLLYLRIYLTGMVFTFLYNAGAGVFRAVGNTRMPMVVLGFSGLANTFLDFLFVGPLHMGVAGAAIATVLAQLFSALFIIWRLYRLVFEDGSAIRNVRGSSNMAAETVRISLPTAFRSALWPIGNSFLYAAINAAGTATIAAFAISSKLMLLLWLSIDSLGPAVTTFVAQNYGARNTARARQGTRSGMVLGLLMMGLYSLVLYFFSESIGVIFLNQESRDILPILGTIMRMQAPFLPIYALGSIFTSSTSGYGDTIGPMFIILLCTCGFRVLWVLTYVPRHPGLQGIVMAYYLAYILTALVSGFYYFFITLPRLREDKA